MGIRWQQNQLPDSTTSSWSECLWLHGDKLFSAFSWLGGCVRSGLRNRFREIVRHWEPPRPLSHHIVEDKISLPSLSAFWVERERKGSYLPYLYILYLPYVKSVIVCTATTMLNANRLLNNMSPKWRREATFLVEWQHFCAAKWAMFCLSLASLSGAAIFMIGGRVKALV